MRLHINKILKTAIVIFFIVAIFTITACSGNASPQEPSEPSTPSRSSQVAAAATVVVPASERVSQASVEPVGVVTTTNIVADWARIVGGDRVEVFSLLPAGSDPHAFQPGAKDVAAIADAEIVLSVGLRLEDSWLRELLQNAARDEASIVALAEIVDPIDFGETHGEEVDGLEEISHVIQEVKDGEISAENGLREIREAIEAADTREEVEEEEGHHGEENEDEDDEHHGDGDGDEEEGKMHMPEMVMEIIAQVEAGQFDARQAIEEIEHLTSEGEDEHEGHGHGIHDPHFWFDPLRVKLAVSDIAARLSVIDPDGRAIYSSNASAYNAQLDELHTWTQEQVTAVPEERRFLVTSHDSFGYFANLYDFEVVGVILSTTTEVEPSPADLVELSHEVEEYNVSAIFGETTVSERLAQSIASESGAELVRLYSGSLGIEGSGAETYLDMIRTNVQRIVVALK